MSDKELKGKSWDELCVQAFKKLSSRKETVQKAIDELEDIWHLFDFSEVEEYIEAMANKIHIPRWNKYPETNPSQLDIYVEEYYVFWGDEFITRAMWDSGVFKIFCSEKGWYPAEEITYWLPLTYPTPY